MQWKPKSCRPYLIVEIQVRNRIIITYLQQRVYDGLVYRLVKKQFPCLLSTGRTDEVYPLVLRLTYRSLWFLLLVLDDFSSGIFSGRDM